MKITRVTPILGQGNICASWVFAKVETDDGWSDTAKAPDMPAP